jgi:chromosome segregation ATPase
LQLEVKEYVVLLQTNNIALPADLVERVMEQQQLKKESSEKKQKAITTAGGSGSSQDVKDLKIKLSHKERELRELQQKLRDQQIFLDKTKKQLQETEKEKDQLALKSEAMAEKLKSNNIEFDSNQFEGKAAASSEVGQKSSIIDQYKAKLAKARQDLDAKIKEIQEKDQKFLSLKQAAERDEKILKKHMEENQRLKK